LPEYKALHDAGYNILAYDIRNHGLSGQGNGGIVGIGLLEYRDVIGSLHYAASRPDTEKMKKVLLSVCLGADSTAVAWSKHPNEFSDIQAMVMLQPVSAKYVVEEFVKGVGMADGYEKFDKAVHERTGFHLAEQSPLEHVKAVTVPTLVAQVHNDTMTRPEDVQSIYDALPVDDKELHWIEGTDRRFDGYNYFGIHPEVAIDWFDKHLE
jgi:pimeloyl-ACP methyl ester carboxylesterase